MDTLSMDEARGMAADWAANNRARDDMIRAVLRAGLSISELQRLTGIARTTVYRAIAPARGPASLPGVDQAPAVLFLAPPE